MLLVQLYLTYLIPTAPRGTVLGVSHGALGFAQHRAVGGFVMASAIWGWAAMQQQAMPPTAA